MMLCELRGGEERMREELMQGNEQEVDEVQSYAEVKNQCGGC